MIEGVVREVIPTILPLLVVESLEEREDDDVLDAKEGTSDRQRPCLSHQINSNRDKKNM